MRTFAPVLALLVTVCGHSMLRADSPQAGVNSSNNFVNTLDKNAITKFNPEEGGEENLLWKAKLGRTSYGGPVVAGGRVYVGTNNANPRDPSLVGDRGVVMCFDKNTGAFLWQHTHDKLPGSEMDYPEQGVVSNVAVQDDLVWYVSNRAEVVCLSAAGDSEKPGKGKVVWSYDMIKELKVFPCQLAVSSPLVVGDLVYVVTGNGWNIATNPWSFPTPEAPSFIALNKKTGALVWQDNSPGKNVMEGQWTSPVYAPNNGKPLVVFPGGDGWLYAFDAAKPDKAVWKFDCNPKSSVYDHVNKRKSDRCYFISAPAVHENKLFIGVGTNPEDGSGVGHVWCIDVTKQGDVSPVNDNFDPKAPENKNSALVWHYGGKVVPTPKGEREYRVGRTLSNVTVVDGLAYIAEKEGFFHCIDASTGEKYWVHDMLTETWSTPYFLGGKVYVGNEDGDILIYDHGKKASSPEAINMGGAVKKAINVVDGIMYVLTDSYLFAFQEK
jgi:outer membrane protein assembly factor BamB